MRKCDTAPKVENFKSYRGYFLKQGLLSVGPVDGKLLIKPSVLDFHILVWKLILTTLNPENSRPFISF